jgi:uncharacterized OsmC-like protein
MRNGMSVSALSEFVNEVSETPEEGSWTYGVKLDWESGARSRVEAKTLKAGQHRVSRSFNWKVDEPRQMLGTNHAPNPQELLLSGLGGCIMISFLAGAAAKGIQIETLSVDVDADVDLHGFLGLDSNNPTGLSEVRYQITVAGDATPEQFDELRVRAISHSPNAQTLTNGVKINGGISVL